MRHFCASKYVLSTRAAAGLVRTLEWRTRGTNPGAVFYSQNAVKAKEPDMSEPRSLSRRSALAGLGAGSIAAFVGAQAAAHTQVENRDVGADSGGSSGLTTATHRLSGLWLSMIGMPSNAKKTVVVPTFFGADGSVMLMFPGTEAAKQGIQVKGPAIGTWEVLDERSGHFTAVQVLSNMNGEYVGTVEVEGFPSLDDEGENYDCDSSRNLFVVRDELNTVVSRLTASVENPMRGRRMRPGRSGFPDSIDPHDQVTGFDDPRTPE